MSVTQTTATEIKDLAYVARSVKLNQIRAEINFAKRQIVQLQAELSSLKAAELIVMQKANRFVKLDTLQKYYHADVQQVSDPIQALRPSEKLGQDPDSRVNWTQNQLHRDLEPFETERDRLAAKIKNLTQLIRKYQKIYEDRMTEFNALGGQASQQLSQDNITKRIYSEIYMMYEVAKRYKDESTGPDGTTTQHSSDSNKMKTYTILKQMFESYAERNPMVLDGSLKLEMDNPGSDTNILALLELLERLRKVLQDAAGEMDERLRKYVSQNESNINDSFISQYVSRQATPKRLPDGTNAMSSFTATTSTMVSRVNRTLDTIFTGVSNKLYMFYDSSNTKFGDALKNWYRRKITSLNNGLPYCTQVDKPADEVKKDTATQQQQQADSSAAAVFKTKLDNTKQVVQNTQITTTIDSLRRDLNTSITLRSGLTDIATANPLTVGEFVYTSAVRYHVRILNQAQRWIDYMNDVWITGNMTDDARNAYLKEIQGILDAVTPVFYLSNAQ